MKPTITIAVDGYAACGKSTLARALARELGYVYIDSGAMYRAVTLYCLRHKVAWNDAEQIRQALERIRIEFRYAGEGCLHTFLNDEDVEQAIRSLEVSAAVSPVSAISAVRRAMVAQQQALGKQGGMVMDGRDIGTVVFPYAELKLFVTASIEVRTRRRLLELQSKNPGQSFDAETVKQNLLERDRIDSTRADSPLRRAEDAVVLDNSELTPEEQLQWALQAARLCIQAKQTSNVLSE